VAPEVGYDSVTQFSRPYARAFAWPPEEDTGGSAPAWIHPV